MNIEHTRLEHGKRIVGIFVRTRPDTATKDISALWGRWMQEGLASQLKAVDSSLYSVYFDYETDHTGAYTTLLGVEVPSDLAVPDGMSAVWLQTGIYGRFFVSGGDPGQAIWLSWSQINDKFSRENPRRYLTDFECYQSISQTHIQAEIWVGLVAP